MVMPFSAQDGAILADYRSEAECSILAKARMQKLINGSMQNVSLSGERGGPACGWWKVESTMLECGKACCCSGIIVTRQSAFLPLSSFNTDLDTKCSLLAKGKNAKAD